MTSVLDLFTAAAADYDHARRQLVPCFDGFYGAALDALSFADDSAPSILDLGAGTGLLSALIAARFPHARLTVTDGATGMVAAAERRFCGARHVTVQRLDFSSDPLPGGFDAVVSALAIHHLADSGKQALMERIFAALKPGGVVVNADQFRAPDDDEDARLHAAWRDEVRALGVAEDALQAALRRMREDRSARLADQLLWLRDAGFIDVACVFQEAFFAVITGRRP